MWQEWQIFVMWFPFHVRHETYYFNLMHIKILFNYNFFCYNFIIA
uniref:Uncharacterized protein n=1 Tax=Spiroplasma kunkelii TaxID=47834 RepID=Q6XYU8_SPIKU|nr:hypothetical protein [Spiroplasma kunkelii CR2-3x]